MSQDYNKLEPGEEVWIYDRSAAPRRHLPTARPIGVADLIVVRVEGVSGHAERRVKMTSLNRARRFVGSGRAVFTGPQAIRFVVDSARTELLQRRAQEAEERLHDRVTGGNYDRIDRVLTLPELARLPLVCPSKILRNE